MTIPQIDIYWDQDFNHGFDIIIEDEWNKQLSFLYDWIECIWNDASDAEDRDLVIAQIACDKLWIKAQEFDPRLVTEFSIIDSKLSITDLIGNSRGKVLDLTRPNYQLPYWDKWITLQ